MGVLKNRKGWITVACAFILQGLTHGLASSMGVFYVQWEEAFPSSSTLISALATSVLATILCTAPIGGAISKKAGIRLAMTFGGALAFAGFCLTSFVYRASLLFITVAAMIGFGSSVVYMASVIAVSNHFNKNFTTASGVANAGASVGVLILPLVFEILVSAYGWRGACLVVSAIQLHVFVCMMIIKAPQKPPQPATPTAVAAKVPATDNEGDGIDVRMDAKSKGGEEGKEDDHESTHERIMGCVNGSDQGSRSRDRIIDLKDKDKGVNRCECGGSGSGSGIGSGGSGSVGNDVMTTEAKHQGRHVPLSSLMDHGATHNEESSVEVRSVAVQMAVTSPEEGDPPSPGNRQTSRQGKVSDTWLHDAVLSGLWYTLDLFNIRLLWTNPAFSTLVVGFSLGGWFLGTILPHLAARAISAGISKLLASSLISIVGAGNLVSRVLYGRLVDSGLVHPVYLIFLAYSGTALSSALVAFATVYSLLCIGAFGIGIGSGIYIPLMQPLVRTLVGPKDFSGGFGLSLLSVGIGNFLSATFAGLIYDLTQNYTYVFLLPTGVGTLCAIVMLANQIVWGNWRKHPNWPTRTKRRPQRKAAPDVDVVDLEAPSRA